MIINMNESSCECYLIIIYYGYPLGIHRGCCCWNILWKRSVNCNLAHVSVLESCNHEKLLSSHEKVFSSLCVVSSPFFLKNLPCPILSSMLFLSHFRYHPARIPDPLHGNTCQHSTKTSVYNVLIDVTILPNGLTVKRYNLERCGRRSFSMAGPSLPSAIRNSISLPAFRSRLKTHLFARRLSLCCRRIVFIVSLF